MQHGDRNDHAPLRLLFDEYAFQPFERAAAHADWLSLAQVGTRLGSQSGTKNRLHRLNLLIRHRRRLASEPYDGDYARRSQNRQTLFRIEAAEEISGEQRLIGFDYEFYKGGTYRRLVSAFTVQSKPSKRFNPTRSTMRPV